MRVLLLALVACAAPPRAPLPPPPSSVPLSVWVAPSLTSTWWLQPAQLCLHADDARPFWDGLQWRCP